MITKDNYLQEVERMGVDYLPEALKAGHNFLIKATSNGKVWESISPTINEAIALQMEKLDSYMKGNLVKTIAKPVRKRKRESAPKPDKKVIEKKLIKPKRQKKTKPKVSPKPKAIKAKRKPAKGKVTKPPKAPVTVKKYALELQHIKRFAGLDKKDHKTTYLKSFHTSIKNHLSNRDYLNHTSMLEDIAARLGKGLEHAEGESAALMSISIEPGIKEKVKDLIANAKVRVRTEFLAGINSESKSKKQS